MFDRLSKIAHQRGEAKFYRERLLAPQMAAFVSLVLLGAVRNEDIRSLIPRLSALFFLVLMNIYLRLARPR